MKKLAAVVMIVATGVFLAVAMASASDLSTLRGVYGMAATGTCLHDKSGFDFSGEGTLLKPYTATPQSDDHFVSTFMGHGAFSFDGRGNGSMWVEQYCVLPPYTGSPTTKVTQALAPSAPLPPDVTQVPFTYEVDGYNVTVTIAASKLTLFGWLSSDHKTMTLQSAMPLPEQGVQYNGLIGYWQICTIVRILNRIGE